MLINSINLASLNLKNRQVSNVSKHDKTDSSVSFAARMPKRPDEFKKMGKAGMDDVLTRAKKFIVRCEDEEEEDPWEVALDRIIRDLMF